MTDLPGIVVTGVSGRMGRMLIEAITSSDKVQLCGALERPAHDWIGSDLGEAMGGAPLGIKVSDDPLETFARAHAVIDFTSPAATVGFAGIAAQARIVHVIGTTGMNDEELGKVAAAARHATIIRA
ncbi:MAG: 4-hydroxy-tetrahydrodipicolinate reductase, partial [Pseudomonadota bacterium]